MTPPQPSWATDEEREGLMADAYLYGLQEENEHLQSRIEAAEQRVAALEKALEGLLDAMTDDGLPLDGQAAWALVHSRLEQARAVLAEIEKVLP